MHQRPFNRQITRFWKVFLILFALFHFPHETSSGMRSGSSVCALGGGVILSLEKRNSYIFVGVSAGNVHLFLRSSSTGRISQLKKDTTCFLPSIRFSSKNILIVPCNAGDVIITMNHSFFETLALSSLDPTSSQTEKTNHDVDQYMEQVCRLSVCDRMTERGMKEVVD